MKTKALRISLLVVLSIFIITTCRKDDKFTVFEISEVKVTDNSVKVTGSIVSISGNGNTEYGVAYGTKNNPSVTDTVFKLGLPKVGPFTAEIKNLKRNKTYYFRGYIKEGNEYLYDDVRSATIVAILPEATSKPVGSLAETTVTLNGSVNPNGSSTTVSFEYGVTTSYGTTVAAATSSLTGSTITDVSASLTALTPNTTYHFRVKATNAAGTVNGEDLTFTTFANVAAPSATTLAITSLTNTTATLNGSVNANGSTTTVSFEYGTTFLYGSTADATPATVSGITPASVSYELTGLVPGQKYHFRVKAVSAGGTTYGEDIKFTTTQPSTVGTLDATNMTQTTATLNGTVNAKGLSTAITFEYGTTTSYELPPVAGVPDNLSDSVATAVKADITGLTENTTYHFRIKAVSSAGTSYGNDLSFTTTKLDLVPPTASSSAATSITNTSATINGQVNANGSSTTVTFEYGTTFLYGSSIDATPGTATGVAPAAVYAILSGLTPNETYHFRVKAVNGTGTVYGDDMLFTTLDPPAATTTAALLIYPTTATLSGHVNPKAKTTSIKFEYGTTTSYGTVLLGVPDVGTGTSDVPSVVNLVGLTKNTLYHFRIVAENSGGISYGNDMTFTTLANDPVVPILSTKSIIDITSATATGGGIISSDGGAEVTARGICYSTNPAPTVDDFRTANGEGSGEFSSPFTGLTPGTLYYVRAYATNLMGTAYGNEVQFTSADPPAELPTISTEPITGITFNAASGGGNISNDGGGSITARGICWSITENPTTAEAKSEDGTGSGVYASSLTGLSANTTYYVRAYATNSAGTAYGDQLAFATSDPPAGLATLTTTTGSDITTSSATAGGDITNDGGGTITERGVCYGTTSGPVITGPKTSDGAGTGVFVSSINGLLASTKYYIRAYATNSAGTAYGSELSFTTAAPDPVLPAITTALVTVFDHNSATAGGNVSSDGGAPVTARGICWSTSPAPTTDNSSITIASGTGGFSGSITGLNFSTLYYVRAWAINSVGKVYGDEVSFTTSPLPYVVPTLATTDYTALTSTTVSTGGTISYNGGDPVTARGVCYGNSSNPTILDNVTSNGIGDGNFISNLTGLSGSTLYYVRAYATNNAGTAYGNQISFTTPVVPGAPVLTTTAASPIGTTTATSGGNITDDGDAGGPKVITAKGVCWSTTANPTTANSKTSDGTGTGSFTSSLTSLIPCTTYHIRAYATNDAGFTAYGSDLTFTTGSVLPTVVTTALTSPTSTSVATGGTISGNCSSTVTERGVCWNTIGTTNGTPPTTANSKLTNGTGSGAFPISITGLIPCTTYYIRAYAVNGSGTQYGNELSFTTSAVVSTITTTAINNANITTTTATVGGTVAGNCTTGVTRGICYKTNNSPVITTANSTVVNSGTGPGAYTVNLTGLTPCTTYYVRAYTTNSAGTVYGDVLTFTTKEVVPGAVTTAAVTSITSSGAISGGTVTGNCSSSVTYGVCWSTSTNPTVALATRTVQTGTPASFASTITGLTRATTYYVRAYATNSTGTTYGPEVPFTTLAVLPTVTTSTISTIISSTATSGGGNVTDEGGAAVTARGVCWSTTANPTTANSTVPSGTGAGSFTSSLVGLTPGTTYWVRAYATNSAGTGYGINRSFSTPANISTYPTVSINGNVWMQSNLKSTGWSAPIGGGGDTSQMVQLPLWYQYNDNATNGSTYGYMYNWSAASSSYNICPSGWHVPSATEWSTLAYDLGGYSVAGGKMNDLAGRRIFIIGGGSSFDYYYWNNAISGHDESSKFYGRGGGYNSGGFYGLLDNTRWWTSTSQRYVRIQYNSTWLYGTNYSSTLTGLAGDAYYIRCKKD